MPEQPLPQVISVSRRTDIPAFYVEWFLRRLDAGFAEYRNPFGGQMYTVSLQPADVLAFVFWSRNYQPLLPHLDWIEQRGYRGYFHLTITGYPILLEPHAPTVQAALDSARRLAERYSPQHVLWRFDPLLISNQTPAAYLLEQFAQLASQLCGYTTRCYISFVDFYGKTRRNLGALTTHGLTCADPTLEEKRALTAQLVALANTFQLKLYACCESGLLTIPGVQQAHCVDADLLQALFPEKFQPLKLAPTRDGCGCFASRDIGAYGTCIHGCRYCYANSHHQQAVTNYQQHQSERAFL
jgi:hypothetical protein